MPGPADTKRSTNAIDAKSGEAGTGARPVSGPPPAEWRQRVGVLCQLPVVLAERGLDPAPVLAGAGLAADALDSPDRWILFEAGVRVLVDAALKADRPEIGVRVGERFALAQIGLLGELIRNSATVGEALASYAVHQRLYSQGFAPHLQVSGGRATFGFAVFHPAAHDLAAAYDVLLAAAVTCLRELGGARWNPVAVHFPRERPVDAGAYRAHFRCGLVFDAEHAAIELPTRDLDRPIAGADPVRLHEVEREVMRQFDGNLLPLLYRALRTLLIEGDDKVSSLAEQFAMHRRTLSRRLRRQGTTFIAVLDDVRYEVARNLLVDTALPATRIAYSLGYADGTAFSRAFRRWSGTSPAQWRARHKSAWRAGSPRRD